ncbi:MAG: ABC transporter permease [bacterium]
MIKILYLIQKELIQILKDKAFLPLIFIAPIVEIILLPFAANFEIKDIKFSVVDNDLSSFSRTLVTKISHNKYFSFEGYCLTENEAMQEIEKEKIDLIIKIPKHFEEDLINQNNGDIQLIVNGVNNTKAIVVNMYTSSIINDFNWNLHREQKLAIPCGDELISIQPIIKNWYNPLLNYKTLMVPGILAELCALITMLLAALNIVREKELGTIEQLNVTPLKKHEFIIGKLIPIWLIGHFLYWLGLLVGKLVFDIPIEGSLLTEFVFISVFLLFVLGIGLFISTIVNTQQEALFVTFFFIMLFILTSGLFTPAEYLPDWVKIFNIINPIKYVVEINRLILIKGTGWDVVGKTTLLMGVYAIIINTLAVIRYKKTV